MPPYKKPRISPRAPVPRTRSRTGDRQARLLKELEIDGTGLRGSPPPRGESYYWRGAYYQRENDQAPAPTRENRETTASRERPPRDDADSRVKQRRRIHISEDADSITTAGSADRMSKTQKRRLPDGGSPPPSKRHRPTHSSQEELFRTSCLHQFQALRTPKYSVQAETIAHIVPFLLVMREASTDRIQRHISNSTLPSEELPEAYVLNSADAKALLASNASIQAPVFVPGGAREVFNPEDGRPVEQVLDEWFIDENEINHVHGLTRGEPKPVKIHEVREHFLAANGPVKQPWNLPDIPNPRLTGQDVPVFASSMNCQYLSEMMRRALDVTELDICQDSCSKRTMPGVCCNDHRLTVSEHTSLGDAVRSWHGTVMLADAGAITHGHWDQWGLGAVIACYEGEIGVCWQSHPTLKERTQWLRDASVPRGRYLFQVLRPGDALYMPPGMVHHVFRRPAGKQTLGLASSILRRNALDDWLEILILDVQHAIDNWKDQKNAHYELVVPALVRQTGYLVGLAKTGRDLQKYGGVGKVKRVKKLLTKLEKMGMELQKLAARDGDSE